MKMVKSLIAVAVAAVMLNGVATQVSAEEVEVNANAKAEVVCETTGQYGQNTNCKAKSDASASAIIKRDGVVTHQVVDTGLDAQGIAMSVGTVVTGIAATVARVRMGK
jgi:hypothetical protein